MPLSASAQTLDEAVAAVVEGNEELRALTLEAEATRAERRAEQGLEGPEVEYSPFWAGGKPGMASSELIVSQRMAFPTVYADRREARRLEGAVLDERYRQALRDVRLEARLLGLDVVRTNQQLDMLRQRLADCDTVLHLLERRLAAGDATALEINKARLTRMTVEQAMAETEGAHAALIARMTALAGGRAVEVTDALFPECPLPPSLEALEEEVAAHSSDLAAARALLEASRHAVATARRAWRPDLTLGYRRNTDEGLHLHGVMLGAAFPLYTTRAKVKAARLKRESDAMRLEAQHHATVDGLRGQYAELLRLHAVLDHSDTALLRETLDLLGRALQHGEISALYYYTETADIYDKLQAHIDLHHRYARLHAELLKDTE